MNSCVASSCTCSPRVSYAFAILVSWPIGDVPLSCRYAFTCLARRQNRRRIKMPLARTVSGVVPSVEDRWQSSKGSRLQKSNFALHRCSLLPHETPLANPNPSRLSARSVSLCLNPTTKLHSQLPQRVLHDTLLPHSLPGVFCRALSHSLRHTPHRCLLPFNLHRPASAATTSGFLLAA